MCAKKVSIIIPVYNEEKTIKQLLNKILFLKLNLDKEIILVNDGSTDKTKEIVESFFKQHVTLLNKKNNGKGSAIRLGIKHATGDILIIQDADLEYDPNEYENLIKPILNGKCKVVYGSRMKKDNKYSYFSYYIGNKIISVLMSIVFCKYISDVTTCYKIFHKELKHILLSTKSNGFEWEIEVTAKVLKNGYKIYEIPISYNPRTREEGKKIKKLDGLKMILSIIKYRFLLR